MSQTPRSKVLFPLYIYPHPGAWDPLYIAITAYPWLDFLIVINPNSGPGAAPWWPNEDYIREIPRLNAFPNVTTLGYRMFFEDIETYAERGRENSGLGVKGIFVDETVNLYSDALKQYLDALDQKVKSSIGIEGDKLVIHNPGTAVNAGLATPGPDITVSVETAYAVFINVEYEDWLDTSPYDRSRSAYIVHSAPEEQVEMLASGLRDWAGFLFITSATSNFYSSFGTSWGSFIRGIAAP